MSSQRWVNWGIGSNYRWFYPFSAAGMRFFMAVFGLWSLFFPYLMTTYDLDAIAPIAVGSSAIGLGTMIFGPPIAGLLLEWFDGNPKVPFVFAVVTYAFGAVLLGVMMTIDVWETARWFWYFGSFFLGVGGGATQGTVSPTISRWFRGERLGTAMGVGGTGGSIGRITLPPLVAFLIGLIGFGSILFLTIGVVGVLPLLLIGVLFWRKPSESEIDSGELGSTNGNAEDGNEDDGNSEEATSESDENPSEPKREYTLREALQLKEFWILFIAMAAASFAYVGFLQNISTILIEGLAVNGPYTEDQVANALVPAFLSMTGVMGVLGRVIWGYVMDRMGGPWKPLFWIYLIPGLAMAVFFLIYQNFILVMLVGAVIFFFSQGEPVVHLSAIPHLFGRENVGINMNVMHSAAVGTGIVFGPTVMAWMADVAGTYMFAIGLAILLRFVSTGAAVWGYRETQKRLTGAVGQAAT